MGHEVRTDLGLALPEHGAAAAQVAELTSKSDREALARIAAARTPATGEASYLIGPDDLLDIRIPDLIDPGGSTHGGGSGGGQVGAAPTVAAAPVFEQGFRVNGAGAVTIPLLGPVPVAGLTATGVERELAQRLVAGGILRKPQVSVQVAEYRHRVVAVVGSVERPGLYPVTQPDATIADLVWAAGGPSKDAGRVIEFSPHSDEVTSTKPIRVDLELLLHAAGSEARTLNPTVRPGDVISVAPGGSVLVDGWVSKPGSYPVTRGLTLSGAVASAGGQLFAADRRHATVKRVLGPGEEESYTVDLDAIAQGLEPDFPIIDGDLVHVPADATRLVPYGVWTLSTRLVNIGASVPLF